MGNTKNIGIAVTVAALATFMGAGIATAASGPHPTVVHPHANGTLTATWTPAQVTHVAAR